MSHSSIATNYSGMVNNGGSVKGRYVIIVATSIAHYSLNMASYFYKTDHFIVPLHGRSTLVSCGPTISFSGTKQSYGHV